jgi:hypothetical protein
MIVHIVLFKPKDGLPAEERRALIGAFERALRDIPTVRGVRVARRMIHGAGYEQSAPDAADFLVAIDFDDLDGLQAYLRHPAHEELGRRFNASIGSALIYDFEIGELSELSSLA